MINLIEIPQRADYKVEYIINNDILTVKIDETIEPFDFTGLEDGVEIASTFHREGVTKVSDVKHLDKKTQAICKLWLG